MEKADSSRRASRHQPNPLPVLAILAKDVGELASKEKEVFSPILKRWHPFAAGVAVATLHICYGNELKQFVSNITELTPDAVQVLRAADKLEQDLVQIAVEDSVDSDDGGKAIIREMPPFEAEGAIANMVKDWIKLRIDRLKEWVDRNLQQEVWTRQFDICFQLLIHKMEATILYLLIWFGKYLLQFEGNFVSVFAHRAFTSQPSALYIMILWKEPRVCVYKLNAWNVTIT